MSMLTTFSDMSRRTSCISAVSSLQLDPPPRGQSAAATPAPVPAALRRRQQQQQQEDELAMCRKAHTASI
jgi:hypothetical protein